MAILFWLAATYICWNVVKNTVLHPLRKYPGPWLWANSRLLLCYFSFTGQGHHKILELHKRYGSVVRVAPGELSFCSPEAWKEIFGRRDNATGEIGKDPVHYMEAKDSILGAPTKKRHAQLRRILTRGFSSQAMLDQEPLIKAHIDLLFKNLHNHEATVGSETPMNLNKWFDFIAADIISDLGFGESFHSLEVGHYHPWAQFFLDALKGIAFATAIKRFKILFALLMALAPKSVVRKHEQMVELTNAMVDKRLVEADRPDFIRAMQGDASEETLDLQEIKANAQVLTMAGYDTTATALAGVTYLLATSTHALEKLRKEIRSAFLSEGDIGIDSTRYLPYLTAVIDEALRIYPPGGSGMPRQVPEGGDTIFNQFVPAGTVLTIWQYALYHSPTMFFQPESFIPERWLGDDRFADDCREAFQPFSYGPRNCIGRNLAYAELRIILARLVWNFDFEIASASRDWMSEQKQYLLWERGPLEIKIRRREFEE